MKPPTLEEPSPFKLNLIPESKIKEDENENCKRIQPIPFKNGIETNNCDPIEKSKVKEKKEPLSPDTKSPENLSSPESYENGLTFSWSTDNFDSSADGLMKSLATSFALPSIEEEEESQTKMTKILQCSHCDYTTFKLGDFKRHELVH